MTGPDAADPTVTLLGVTTMSAPGGGGDMRWESSPDDPATVAAWARARLRAEADPDGEEEEQAPRRWVVRRRRGASVSITGVDVYDWADATDRPPFPPPAVPPTGTRSVLLWTRGSHTPPSQP